MNIIFGGSKEYTDKDELKADLRNLYKYIKEANIKKIKKILSSKKGKYLLNVPDELDQTSVMVAARTNDIEVLDTVLSSFRFWKVDINAPDKSGYTMMHHFFSMADLDAKILLMILDQAEVQVDITNRDLNTPLHYFCQKYRSVSSVKEVFEKLIQKGANVNAINRNGEAPIHKAIFNTTIAPTMVSLLLENQANVNVTNRNGESGLHYCVRLGRTDLVTLLLKYGADKTVTKDNKSLYDIAIEENFTTLASLLNGGDVNQSNNGSTTELITLLQNPTLREDFRAFLRDELICEENISFWLDVESYKHLKVDTAQRLLKEMYRIYDKYIPDNAPSEINVPFAIKKDVMSYIKTLPTMTEIEHQMPPLLLLNISNLPTSNSSTNSSTTSSVSNTPNLSPSTSNTNINSSSKESELNSSPPSIVTPLSISEPATPVIAPSSSTTPSTPSLPNSNVSTPQITPAFDFKKIQSVYNIAQQHVFMLMAADSLAKYKKRTRKSTSYTK